MRHEQTVHQTVFASESTMVSKHFFAPLELSSEMNYVLEGSIACES